MLEWKEKGLLLPLCMKLRLQEGANGRNYFKSRTVLIDAIKLHQNILVLYLYIYIIEREGETTPISTLTFWFV